MLVIEMGFSFFMYGNLVSKWSDKSNFTTLYDFWTPIDQHPLLERNGICILDNSIISLCFCSPWPISLIFLFPVWRWSGCRFTISSNSASFPSPAFIFTIPVPVFPSTELTISMLSVLCLLSLRLFGIWVLCSLVDSSLILLCEVYFELGMLDLVGCLALFLGYHEVG